MPVSKLLTILAFPFSLLKQKLSPNFHANLRQMILPFIIIHILIQPIFHPMHYTITPTLWNLSKFPTLEKQNTFLVKYLHSKKNEKVLLSKTIYWVAHEFIMRFISNSILNNSPCYTMKLWIVKLWNKRCILKSWNVLWSLWNVLW